MKEFWNKIRRRWIKLRLQPIRVFCIHHVSDTFDESTMHKGDWMETNAFKRSIFNLQQRGYTFISLTEAYEKMQQDLFRCPKYAVLTADDGWASLRNILPWLHEQKIPITLFLNPGYLDGKHFRDRETEKYLTEKEVQQLHEQYPLVTVGSHGWEHHDTAKQSIEEFENSVSRSAAYLQNLPNYIPFFAYTWGIRYQKVDAVLHKAHLTPVLIDGYTNYNDINFIHRETLQ